MPLARAGCGPHPRRVASLAHTRAMQRCLLRHAVFVFRRSVVRRNSKLQPVAFSYLFVFCWRLFRLLVFLRIGWLVQSASVLAKQRPLFVHPAVWAGVVSVGEVEYANSTDSWQRRCTQFVLEEAPPLCQGRVRCHRRQRRGGV